MSIPQSAAPGAVFAGIGGISSLFSATRDGAYRRAGSYRAGPRTTVRYRAIRVAAILWPHCSVDRHGGGHKFFSKRTVKHGIETGRDDEYRSQFRRRTIR